MKQLSNVNDICIYSYQFPYNCGLVISTKNKILISYSSIYSSTIYFFKHIKFCFENNISESKSDSNKYNNSKIIRYTKKMNDNKNEVR